MVQLTTLADLAGRVVADRRTLKQRGRHGFDVGVETLSACRGTDHLVKPAVNLIVANDDNYALAA